MRLHWGAGSPVAELGSLAPTGKSLGFSQGPLGCFAVLPKALVPAGHPFESAPLRNAPLSVRFADMGSVRALVAPPVHPKSAALTTIINRSRRTQAVLRSLRIIVSLRHEGPRRGARELRRLDPSDRTLLRPQPRDLLLLDRSIPLSTR